VAYDEKLAERIRAALPGGAGERKMFGGIAWMVGDHMACGIMGDALLARLGPEGADAAVAEPHVEHAEMGGRLMKGYVLVQPEGLADDESLQGWVDRSVAFAEGLPPK
jgi:TfoX/Sxy family transcriptional regulator of competence genes